MHTIYKILIITLLCSVNFFSQETQEQNISKIIDGSGNILPGVKGSYSTTGYTMSLGANGRPLFKPKKETIAIHWSGFGTGADNIVRAIAISGNDVYIGGYFNSIDGIPAKGIAKWNGTAWTSLGSGIDNSSGESVEAIAITGNDVYVGGSFTKVGTTNVNCIAVWNTISNTWSALESGVMGTVFDICISGDNVYVGGSFNEASSVPVNNIAKWSISGNSWSALGSGITGGSMPYVTSIAVSAGGDVYAGGDFTLAGGNPVSHIAKWSITGGWSSLGLGLNDIVNTIAISGNDLYAGGAFSATGLTPVSLIAKWSISGGTWSPLGDGFTGGSNTVEAISIVGDYVYAGGGFLLSGGNSANYIAKWDGTSWSGLSGGLEGAVFALAPCTNAGVMVVGGLFSNPPGNYNYIAKFDDLSNPSLPVELTSFTASTVSNGVELKWQTATEQNNYGFEVLRFSPALGKSKIPVLSGEGAGGGWIPLGFVNGSGNSNSPKEYYFVDTNPIQGNAQYRLKQIDLDGNYKYYSQTAEVIFSPTDVNETSLAGPTEFGLSQNYPNPFNPSTTISYSIPENPLLRGLSPWEDERGVSVTLKVYDMLGNEVSTLVNETKAPGYYQAVFDAGNLSTGVYIYRLAAGSFTSTKKLMLMK